jgi:hypothetical protein
MPKEVQMLCRISVRHVTGALILLVSMAVFVAPAAAATVNITLTLTPDLGQRAEEVAQKQRGQAKRYYWRVPNGAVATEAPRVNPSRDLAVILESADGGSVAPAGATKVVKLQGARLNPSVIVVTPHTNIRFRNDDGLVYELRCPENSAMANGQVVPPGREAEFSFDQVGVFEITDRRLPHLIGYVVVVGTAYGLNPAAGAQVGQSSVSFTDVQPGRYVVKVFHGGEWVAQQALEVTETEEVGLQMRVPADGQQHEQAAGVDAQAGH